VSRRTNRARKARQESGNIVERSTRNFQENVARSAPVAAASYTLIGAIIVLGSIGYAIDKWRGTSPWFLLGGLLFGIFVGFYELAKVVWKR
jgi:F0F1-type ATP synthase assembly protein I